ncbi:MAG: hypothetical protein ACOYJ2_01005 [Rickettsiales bacterium]
MTDTPKNPYVTAYMFMTQNELLSISTRLSEQARFIGGLSEQKMHFQQVEALGIVLDLHAKAEVYLRGGKEAEFPAIPEDLREAFLSIAKVKAVMLIENNKDEMTSFVIPNGIAAEVAVALQDQAIKPGARRWVTDDVLERTGYGGRGKTGDDQEG